MTASIQQATDDMYGEVRTVMLAFPTVERRWDGVDSHEPPDTQMAWVYALIRHADRGQATLAGDTGLRRWNAIGTLTVQVFVPLNKQGSAVAKQIADALVQHFQDLETEHCVWFRNAMAQEIGPSDAWYQVNFKATFTYDQIS